MVDIVAIHGINMHRSQRTAMRESWRAAMVEGLVNVRSRHAEALTVECAFYGHEYNDGKAGTEPEYAAIDLEAGFEKELVLAIGAALDSGRDNDSRTGSGTGTATGTPTRTGEPPEETKLYLPGGVQRALALIQRSNLFDGRDSRLIAFVKQVNRYLTDPDFRQRVHREMETAMAHSPRLVVAHSLGSVIAYDWLRENHVEHPPALITLGSPLGLESIRRRVSISARGGGRPSWPGQARTWTNIAAGHDAVATVKKLAPLYAEDIRDLPCDNPRKSAHSAVVYLANVHTARTIDAVLDMASA